MIKRIHDHAANRHIEMWDDGYEATHAGEKPGWFYTLRMQTWGWIATLLGG